MPFLFFLGLLAAGAAVGTMVGVTDDTEAEDDSTPSDDERDDSADAQGEQPSTDEVPEDGPEEDAEPEDDFAAQFLFGELDVDDHLIGGAGEDTIVGHGWEDDYLEGGEGDDDLFVSAGNMANGGAGADTFYLEADNEVVGRIEDFDASEDMIVLRNYESPVDGSSGNFVLTQEDGGLALRDADTGDVRIDLPGASLADGESLSVVFQHTDGDAHDSEVQAEWARDYTIQDKPYVADALRGGAGEDTLIGDDSDNRIFGEAGADDLQGGEGDDHIFSGSGSVFYGAEWNHEPGHLNRLGAGDTLSGGAGEDVLWLGSGNVATGGADADTFEAFAGVYDNVTEITDFAPGEDKLVISFGLDGPFGAGFQNADNEYFTVAEAADGFDSSYDADADETTLTLGGHPLLVLNGDQTGATVAFSNQDAADNYDLPEVWLDANGDPITAEQGQAADILFSGMTPQDMYDANGNGGMVA
jgi:Ca2+-binding RTX toxin-like protein